jgi:hypothetical protein
MVVFGYGFSRNCNNPAWSELIMASCLQYDQEEVVVFVIDWTLLN